MKKPEVADYFAYCIMKCVPKSYGQALAEVRFDSLIEYQLLNFVYIGLHLPNLVFGFCGN